MTLETLREMIRDAESMMQTTDYHIAVRRAALDAEIGLRKLELAMMQYTVPQEEALRVK